MKDYLGNELEIGQHVLYIAHNYNSNVDFQIAQVKRFTPKFVILNIESKWNQSISELRKDPNKTIVLSESNAMRYELGQKPIRGIWEDKDAENNF